VNGKSDPVCYSEASNLIEETNPYRFFLCPVIWYNILKEIDKVNKLVEQEKVQLDMAVMLIRSTTAEME
jgi:hypothetical protein